MAGSAFRLNVTLSSRMGERLPSVVIFRPMTGTPEAVETATVVSGLANASVSFAAIGRERYSLTSPRKPN